MKLLKKHHMLLILSLFSVASTALVASPVDENEEDIESLRKTALKQPMSRQLVAMLPFGGGGGTPKKIQNVAQPGDMSQRQADALIKLATLVESAVQSGDADHIDLHKDLAHGHRDAFISYIKQTPGFSAAQASELRSLFLMLFTYKHGESHLFRRTLCNMVTHIMLVQSKAASKNRLLELAHLLASYRTKLITQAQQVPAHDELVRVIDSFLRQTETVTALPPRKGVIRRSVGTLLWALGKTIKFIIDSPLHIMSLPLRFLGFILRKLGVSKESAGTPNRWLYKLRTPYYIFLITAALAGVALLEANRRGKLDGLAPRLQSYAVNGFKTYIADPFVAGHADVIGFDPRRNSSFDPGKVDREAVGSLAVGGVQGFTGAVAAPFVTMGDWANRFTSWTLGPNGRRIPFIKKRVGPVNPHAVRTTFDNLAAAHDTHLATVARNRALAHMKKELEKNLTPEQKALPFTQKLPYFSRYQEKPTGERS